MDQYKLKDAVIGFAVGDALGVPDEFKNRGEFICKGMRASNNKDFHGTLPLGTWSDDTSLMLCVLDSLYEDNHRLIGEKWAKNAISWKYHGDFSATGDLPFDIGTSCNLGIAFLKQGGVNLMADNVNSNGNGGLMRVMPITFYPTTSIEEIMQLIKTVNECSHNHNISHVGCLIYIMIGKNILSGKDIRSAINNVIYQIPEEYHIPEYEMIWSGRIGEMSEDEVKSNGYVVDTLLASLWALYTSSSYKMTVLKAVNLGNNTDTTSAIAGGLAGMYYGYRNIPITWRIVLKRRTYIYDLINNRH